MYLSELAKHINELLEKHGDRVLGIDGEAIKYMYFFCVEQPPHFGLHYYADDSIYSLFPEYV